jgi:hypothetical protein
VRYLAYSVDYDLFNDALSRPEYVASNGRMINE